MLEMVPSLTALHTVIHLHAWQSLQEPWEKQLPPLPHLRVRKLKEGTVSQMANKQGAQTSGTSGLHAPAWDSVPWHIQEQGSQCLPRLDQDGPLADALANDGKPMLRQLRPG